MNTTNTINPSTRLRLLSTASALALAACLSCSEIAHAADADRPVLWIELGGQAENVQGQGAVFAPGFLTSYADSPVLHQVTPAQAQRPSAFSFGEEGSISFQPEDSEWLFSAAIRYGRSSSQRHVQHQTNHVGHLKYLSGVPSTVLQTTAKFADTHTERSEKHLILDFSAGKDMGLGLFGSNGSSILSAGVRFAQFASKQDFNVRARPDLGFKYHTFGSFGYPNFLMKMPYFHTYYATGHAERDFRGVGPSLSWRGSMPIVGNLQNGEINVDFGLNGALLFGRQTARVGHHESGHYQQWKYGRIGSQPAYPLVYQNIGRHITNKSVTVPNVGGFAGISYRYADAKISLGYRADFFSGAMDTGIDAVKKSNMTFNGPYASVSVGLGD